jgi:hypothetical protein
MIPDAKCCRRFAKLANLRKGGSFSDADLEPHGMVMNIGERPTMADGGGVTVEVGVLASGS